MSTTSINCQQKREQRWLSLKAKQTHLMRRFSSLYTAAIDTKDAEALNLHNQYLDTLMELEFADGFASWEQTLSATAYYLDRIDAAAKVAAV